MTMTTSVIEEEEDECEEEGVEKDAIEMREAAVNSHPNGETGNKSSISL